MRRIILPAVLVLAAAACTVPDDSSDPNLATPPPAGASTKPAATKAKPKPKSDTYKITYKVGGSAAKGSITYSTPSGQEQRGGASLPWRKTFKVKRDAFSMLDVSVQNGGASGTVTCEIDVDGKRVKAAKSSGAYAVVMCDHSLGF